MLGTYAAALFVIAASIPIGGAALWLSGRREWSWLAPALGLAVITVSAWLLSRLPGEGTTALIGLVVLALAACPALPRTGFGRRELGEGLVAGILALLAVSIPFAVEGHFGIIGTGFNVDMSQHLFAATGIGTGDGPTPTLVAQGYPVGPHAIAGATRALAGDNLVYSFTGVTIAVPVVLAMTALAGTRDLGPRRGVVAAALVAVPYLLASYFAQGAFKELFEATFLVAFVLWLRELEGGRGVEGRGFLIPGSLLIAGTLYAYSGPGVAWLAAAFAIWALIVLVRRRDAAAARLRAALPAIGVAAVVLIVLIAPEASRIIDFGASAGNIADAKPEAALPVELPLYAQEGSSDARGTPNDFTEYDNSLGNLFGFVPALEVFGVWPTGDFRVAAGDGAVPAAIFYLGALLGLAGLAIGLRRALADDEYALLAGLAAAGAIWVAAWGLSTPYTSAKALTMVAPLLTLISLRGVLQASFSPLRPRPGIGTAFTLVLTLALAGSSVLALANAPVGPSRYTTAIAKFRAGVVGSSVLVLAPADQISGRHIEDFYRWELRGSEPICIGPVPEDGIYGVRAPSGFDYVITAGATNEAPFTDLRRLRTVDRVELWAVDPAAAGSTDARAAADGDGPCGLPAAG